MSLATRCPHCNILFKVTSGQLHLHEGKVRCGQCQTVFSGIDHLTSADTEVWQKLEFNSTSADQETTDSQSENRLPKQIFGAPSISKLRLDFHQGNKTLQAICLGLLLVFVLQIAWWQRLTWVGALPDLAKTIQDSGSGIQKAFALPATHALEVAGSGLQALDENNLRVDITLHNRTTLPSTWPHLKIDLLDTQGLLLASKSLTPKQYQVRDESSASEARLIPSQKTVELLAYLNLSNLNKQLPETAATGFRVQIFDAGPALMP